MLLWRSRVSTVPFSFSVKTFVEQFPVSKPITFRSQTRKICSKLETITSVEGSPHFKNLNSRQKEQIHVYVDALLDWNQKMNLTAVKDATEIMERHIEDSLAIMPPMKSCYMSHCKKACDKLSLVDVGSGQGLPGIVLAIAFPCWEVTLLESMKKRCVFLEHVVDLTGLSNAQIVRGRAEGRIWGRIFPSENNMI